MATGDHIYVNCFGYSHHGIDCGDGRVVHFDFTPKRKLAAMFLCRDSSIICETSIEEFSGGREIHVRQYDPDSKSRLFSGDEVVRRARSRMGKAKYNLFGNNCEHFAIWCKTDASFSTQVDSARHASRPLAKGIATSMFFRNNPLLPPQLRMAASGIALSYSFGRAAHRYYHSRRDDAKSNRS